jgi:hypothetical protein
VTGAIQGFRERRKGGKGDGLIVSLELAAQLARTASLLQILPRLSEAL